MKQKNLGLYFIALVPEEPAYIELMLLKNEVNDRFNSKAALRSPPHITLHMPFQWKEEKEIKLINALTGLVKEQTTIMLHLKDFGAFPPRVIYVNVEENESLNGLQSGVLNLARSKWHIYPRSSLSRPFKPHITIAFRDLKKAQFIEAWSEFKQRKYNADVVINHVCLLKHNGKSWDILHRAALNPG